MTSFILKTVNFILFLISFHFSPTGSLVLAICFLVYLGTLFLLSSFLTSFSYSVAKNSIWHPEFKYAN